MLERCLMVTSKHYPGYGGAGVTVDPRWVGPDGFVNFLADMGACPADMSIDRYPDQTGGYTKSNCRWATTTQQQRNRSSNRPLTHGGVTRLLTEWAAVTGVSKDTIGHRLARKWTTAQALGYDPPPPRRFHGNPRRPRGQSVTVAQAITAALTAAPNHTLTTPDVVRATAKPAKSVTSTLQTMKSCGLVVNLGRIRIGLANCGRWRLAAVPPHPHHPEAP